MSGLVVLPSRLHEVVVYVATKTRRAELVGTVRTMIIKRWVGFAGSTALMISLLLSGIAHSKTLKMPAGLCAAEWARVDRSRLARKAWLICVDKYRVDHSSSEGADWELVDCESQARNLSDQETYAGVQNLKAWLVCLKNKRNEAQGIAASPGDWSLPYTSEQLDDMLEEEKKQAAEEKTALLKAFLENPKAVRLMLSARLCAGQERRKRAMVEIAQEKKYARIGGALNLSKLRELQDEVRTADTIVAQSNLGLKQEKAKPLSCAQEDVQQAAYKFMEDTE